MTYAKVLGTQCVEYPYGFAQLQEDNPYTNYGSNVDVAYWFPQTEAAAQGYALVVVVPTQQPEYDHITQGIRELTPVDTDGVWHQVWEVYGLTPQEIAYNTGQAMLANKNIASEILSQTDWTTIPDVSDPAVSNPYLANASEFAAYRSTIRKIAVNPPAVVNPWPTPPMEDWVTLPTN